jgi:hypothetical protein
MHRRAAEGGIGKAEEQGSAKDEPRCGKARRGRRGGRDRGENVTDALRLGRERVEVEARGLLECGARRPEHAPDRHVGEDADEEERHQRAQVAAAGAHEVAARAAAGEHHAEAEHESAEDIARPVEPRREIHRFRELHDVGERQRLRPGDRDRGGKHPRPESPPVAERDDVGDRAHRAEVRAIGDRPEGEADEQAAERERKARVLADELANRRDVLHAAQPHFPENMNTRARHEKGRYEATRAAHAGPSTARPLRWVRPNFSR